jgi:hypothetical protein|tara:strand:+ start:495 stop:620 length:126 start_codon:yes stop_codon:yes gene_type:complete
MKINKEEIQSIVKEKELMMTSFWQALLLGLAPPKKEKKNEN